MTTPPPAPSNPPTPQQTGLASPAASSSSAASAMRSAAGLPHPRNKALRSGFTKHAMVMRYVEERLLHISRRHVKKFGRAEPGDTVVGYKGFGEVCRDLAGVVNVLWLSGTPSLQVPFLLKLASDFTQYIPSYPPSPKISLALLRKLDHCFASLLSGKDTQTGEALPGFESGLRAGMTVTDMIRCRSLVEQTRVLVVGIMSGGFGIEEDEEEEEDDDETETETETGTGTETGADTDAESELGLGLGEDRRRLDVTWDDGDSKLHLDAARVYQETIQQLSNRLDGPKADDAPMDAWWPLQRE